MVNTVDVGAEALALDADQMSELAEKNFILLSWRLVGTSGNQRSVRILISITKIGQEDQFLTFKQEQIYFSEIEPTS